MRLLIDSEIVDLPQAVEALEKSRKQGSARRRRSPGCTGRTSGKGSWIPSKSAAAIPRDTSNWFCCPKILMESSACSRRSHPDIRWLRHPAGILVKFSEAFECQLCHISYQEPEPRLFSFNNPFGACPECQGFGNTLTIDFDLVIPDKSKSLVGGRRPSLDKAAVPQLSEPHAAVCGA